MLAVLGHDKPRALVRRGAFATIPVAVRTREKRSSRGAASPVKGWQRHVEGWQPGLVAIFIAGTAALVAVPHAVPPFEIPEPMVQPAALAELVRADSTRADRVQALAQQGKLDFDVRALGDSVRAFGRAEDVASAVALEQAHRAVIEAAHRAIAGGAEAVLGLRAHQMRAFVLEMQAFARTGEASAELVDLGGTFPRSAEAYGWYGRAERRLLADEAVLGALYKRRWNEVTGLTGPVFALSLDEQRVLHRFLIAHPAVAAAPLGPEASDDIVKARAIQLAVAADEKRLDKIRDLGKLDPTFPAALAEGVVLFRLGKFEAAAVAFDRHLHRSPDGPWTLRARNYLKAALEAQ